MAVHASVRRHAPEIANPIAPNEDNLILGGRSKNFYLGECSGCHVEHPGKAPTGRGNSESSGAPLARGWNGVLRGTDFLGGQAWRAPRSVMFA